MPETMAENIKAGNARVNYLRDYAPACEIYNPHEHEHLFQDAYQQGLINSDGILNQCMSILKLCDIVVVCTPPEESQGVRLEIEVAHKNAIPVLHVWRFTEHEWPNLIRDFVSNKENPAGLI